jgi:hypothetical protein
LPKLRLWSLMMIIGLVALDLFVMIHAPAIWSLRALALTAALIVLGLLRFVIRLGNRGPGKTLY